ncbi:MAG: DJ-1/PfpI family protein [Chloroflexota bacterium]|nr:MAG: DJ-1/PfpI family protein [Chloroflexota bacterium]
MGTSRCHNRPVQRVAILIFDDVEVLDFCGPFEVLASARVPGDAPRSERPRAFEVFTVTAKPGIVTCRGGLRVEPTYSFADCPRPDILVIPGGYGVETARRDPAIVAWVRDRSAEATLTTSVCTGAFLLAQAGLLDGQPATTHWAEIAAFRREFPAIDVRDDHRIVDLGPIITSAGVSAGLDMALHLINRVHGEAAARETARSIEYRWEPVPTLVASPN